MMMSLPSIGFSLYPEELRPVSTFHSVGTASYPTVIPAKSPFLASPAPGKSSASASSASSPFASSASPFSPTASASSASSPFASSASPFLPTASASSASLAPSASVSFMPATASPVTDTAALSARIEALEIQNDGIREDIENMSARLTNCVSCIRQTANDLADVFDTLNAFADRLDSVEMIFRSDLFDGCCDDPLFNKTKPFLDDNSACFFRNDCIEREDADADGVSETKEHTEDTEDAESADGGVSETKEDVGEWIRHNDDHSDDHDDDDNNDDHSDDHDDDHDDDDHNDENDEHDNDHSDDEHVHDDDDDDHNDENDEHDDDKHDNDEHDHGDHGDHDVHDDDVHDIKNGNGVDLDLDLGKNGDSDVMFSDGSGPEGGSEGSPNEPVNDEDSVGMDFSVGTSPIPIPAPATGDAASKIRTITFIKQTKTPTKSPGLGSGGDKESITQKLRGKRERDLLKLRVPELVEMLSAFGELYAAPKQDAVKLLLRRVTEQQQQQPQPPPPQQVA